MIHTIETGSHVAHLHALSGEGLLVLPHPRQNVWLGTQSIHEADWNEMLGRLDAVGYELSEGEDGSVPSQCATTRDGRAVVGLYGRDPIASNPSLDLMAEGSAALLWHVCGNPVAAQ